MYLCVQCPIKSSKSYLVAHRHVQVIGTEKKKNSKYISDGACRIEVRLSLID